MRGRIISKVHSGLATMDIQLVALSSCPGALDKNTRRLGYDRSGPRWANDRNLPVDIAPKRSC